MQTNPDESRPIDRSRSAVAEIAVPNETIVFLLALAIISCVGFALLPVAAALGLTDGPKYLHGFIIDPFLTFVKSRDSFLFVTLTAFGPLAVVFAFLLLRQRIAANRWLNTEQWRERLNIFGGLFFLLFVASVFSKEDSFRVIASYALAPPGILVAGLVLIFLTTAFVRFPSRVSRLVFRISLSFIGLASIALTLLTLTTRITMITDSGAFWNHLDPVMFSIGQAAGGGKCLQGLIPQYGCYGQFVGPLLKLFGTSLFAATLMMAILQVLALGATFAFIIKFVENRLCALTCCIFVLGVQDTTGFMGGGYPYLQYWPIRTLFPALSLLIVAWWPRRTTTLLSVAAGVFGGCAAIWNVDSGVVVLIALALFVVLRSFDAAEGGLRKPAGALACYAAGSALVILGFAFWAQRHSIVTALANAVFYQRTFYLGGLVSEPTPAIPAAWCGALALSGLAIVLYVRDFLARRTTPASHAMAFLAVLAVGVFQYYTGRSLPPVFSAVSWPFIILAFILVDRALRAVTTSPLVRLRRIVFGTVSALLASCMVSILLQCVASLPTFYRTHFDSPTALGTELRSDADFIKETASDTRDVAIFDTYGAELLLESDKRFQLARGALQEMVRRSDFRDLISAVEDHGSEHLYIGADLLHSTEADIGYARILSTEGMPGVNLHYAFMRWNPNGQLAFYERKPSTSIARAPQGHLPKLAGRTFHATLVSSAGAFFDDADLPYQPQFSFPTARDHSFAIDLRVRPSRRQPYVSTVVSNHCCFRGAAVEALGLPNQYRLVLGNGTQWQVFPFYLEDARTSRMTISYEAANGHLFLAVAGKRIYDRSGVGFAPSGLPITVGNWGFGGGRPFTGVREIAYYPRAIRYATTGEGAIPCVGSPELPPAAPGSEPASLTFGPGFNPPAADAAGAYRTSTRDSVIALRNDGPRRDTVTLTAYVRTTDGRSGTLRITRPGSAQTVRIGSADTKIVMAATADPGVAVRFVLNESDVPASAKVAGPPIAFRMERLSVRRSGCLP